MTASDAASDSPAIIAPVSPDPVSPYPASPDPENTATAPIAQVVERVEDLSRVIARQAQTLDRLIESDRARARQAASGADLPLLVDLFGLFIDATTCAASAGDADADAFTALAAGLDRMITGRGGVLVVPSPGTQFDARTMEAVDVVEVDDAAADLTVAQVLRPGLLVGDRSVRAAAVVVRRAILPAG